MSNAISSSLVYKGLVIRDRDQMLCLTDMWKAAGSPVNREPYNWVRFDGAPFIQFVASNQNLSDTQVLQAERGRNGGTWAHWQVGMAYAQYLSPDFHAWCNSVVRQHMEGRLAPPGAFVTHTEFRQFAGQVFDAVSEVQGQVTALQAEARSRFDLIGEQLSQATRPRKEISAKVKGTIAVVTAQLGGYCPCCSRHKIVDDNGRKVAEAEYDHFYSNQMPDAEHVWLICKPCHDDLTFGRVSRVQVDIHFSSFQRKRRDHFG
ncbi:MAG: KilA-N domain-containing protein [Alphaproteobacteria bacterium]|nr:KilA-N domain-containing protein [Alphaproteobacteria bacterium]